MGMTCKICTHPERVAIDRAIVEQRSLRDISGQYGISRSSVDRHKSHIPKELAKAKKAETVAESGALLSRVEKLMGQADRIYEGAMKSAEWSGAAAAAREMRGCLELLGKIGGELSSGGTKVAISVGIGRSSDLSRMTDEELDSEIQRLARERVLAMSDTEFDEEIQRMLSYRGVPKSLCAKLPQTIEGA
jgi:hypothetical protein